MHTPRTSSRAFCSLSLLTQRFPKKTESKGRRLLYGKRMRGNFANIPVEKRAEAYDERDVLALATRCRVLFVPCPCFFSARAGALSVVRKLPPFARRIVLSGLVAAITHCRALHMPVTIHAGNTLLSPRGDVLITLTHVTPDLRYTAPETHFGFPPCHFWSLVCVLYKLITGAAMITQSQSAPRAAVRLVGTLQPASCHRLDALFDAFAASKMRNKPARFRVPPSATRAERALLIRAVSWERSCLYIRDGRIYCEAALDPIDE
jgi:hypothetical protein